MRPPKQPFWRFKSKLRDKIDDEQISTVMESIEGIIPKEIPDRSVFVWNGVTISKRFSRRPRVLHLEASKPRGSKINQSGSW